MNSYGDESSSDYQSSEGLNYGRRQEGAGYYKQPTVLAMPNYTQNNNQSDYLQPLETIQEGGSSVSSGGQHSCRYSTQPHNFNHFYQHSHVNQFYTEDASNDEVSLACSNGCSNSNCAHLSKQMLKKQSRLD